MPIYDYQCSLCKGTWDELQNFSDPILTTCKLCGEEGNVQKIFNGRTSFHLKGGGWARDGYRPRDKRLLEPFNEERLKNHQLHVWNNADDDQRAAIMANPMQKHFANTSRCDPYGWNKDEFTETETKVITQPEYAGEEPTVEIDKTGSPTVFDDGFATEQEKLDSQKENGPEEIGIWNGEHNKEKQRLADECIK